MAGSEAEERIRAKAEAWLRGTFPTARIIHELVLRQGGVRIDLAGVTPDRLICIEIKSERDVLTRLPEQVAAMKLVCDTWRVVSADKHIDKVREITGWIHAVSESELTVHRCDSSGWSLTKCALEGVCNSPARLDMLWADELRRIAGAKGARWTCIRAASDSMTGAEVRRAVCAAIRSRSFPRADNAIPMDDMGVLLQ